MAERVLWTGEDLNLSVGRQTIFKQAFISIAERNALLWSAETDAEKPLCSM
jgi:hypothetical protein